MNAKALIPLVSGLAIAGLAAKLGLDFIKKAEGKQAQMVSLWTPLEDINRGVAIDESMLRPLAFPLDATPAGALADIEKIKGRVPHTGAPAGVPILESMLLPPGVRAGVRVPPGFRAVAVKIDESSGVDNHLEPGCHVDVVGVFTVRERNRTETIARTLLENVEVAAVGQRLAPKTPEPADEKGGRSAQRERPARAVTLLVRPRDVPALHLAEQKGKIKLSMRGALDEGRGGKTPNVTEDEILGQRKPEEPEPSWREKFDQFVNSFWKQDQLPEPEQIPQPAPVPGQASPLAWVMRIYNGDERLVLGWKRMDDLEPIEMSSSARQNIFEDGPRYPPLKPEPPSDSTSGREARTGQSGSQSEGNSNTDSESEPESEPKELFE